MVKTILAGVEKSKSTPICLYVFHLYHAYDTIRADDKKAYIIGELMMKHNVKSDQEDKLVVAKDFEHKSLSPNKIAELQE